MYQKFFAHWCIAFFGKNNNNGYSLKDIYNEIIKAPVYWMFHLCSILQFVIYGLYDIALPQQQFVRNRHKHSFKFRDKLYPIYK